MDMLKIDATTIGFCLNSFALGKIKMLGEVNQWIDRIQWKYWMLKIQNSIILKEGAKFISKYDLFISIIIYK